MPKKKSKKKGKKKLKKRPSLGTGMAEITAKKLEKAKARKQGILDRIMKGS
jgi:hypothetical protein